MSWFSAQCRGRRRRRRRAARDQCRPRLAALLRGVRAPSACRSPWSPRSPRRSVSCASSHCAGSSARPAPADRPVESLVPGAGERAERGRTRRPTRPRRRRRPGRAGPGSPVAGRSASRRRRRRRRRRPALRPDLRADRPVRRHPRLPARGRRRPVAVPPLGLPGRRRLRRPAAPGHPLQRVDQERARALASDPVRLAGVVNQVSADLRSALVRLAGRPPASPSAAPPSPRFVLRRRREPRSPPAHHRLLLGHGRARAPPPGGPRRCPSPPTPGCWSTPTA